MSELCDDDAVHFAGLRTVDISCEVETPDISDLFLASLGSVEKLNMSMHMGINGDGFKHLTSLRSLTMDDCAYVDPEALATLPHPDQLRELRGLYTNLDDESLAPLTGLRTLDARECESITIAGVSRLTSLRELHLSGSSAPTEAELALLPGGLTTLNLSDGNDSMTGAGLAHLKALRELYVNRCKGVTDDALAALPGLRRLHVEGCSQLSGACFARLRGLRTVMMDGCSQRAIDAARAVLPEGAVKVFSWERYGAANEEDESD